MTRWFLATTGALLLAGCGAHSSNLRTDNQQSLVSLSDQRAAQSTVMEYPSMPAGAHSLGEVDAARCHRKTNEVAATDAAVLSDLKIAAYARGATGITDVRIVKKSGLMANCWHILDGRATAITTQPAQ